MIELPIRYVNAGHDEAPRIQAALDKGHTVVNATRPLSGDEYWEGSFIAGLYYTAGDIERWGQHWKDYGGYQLKLVTNAQVLQTLVERCKGHPYGSRLKSILEKRGPGGVRELAWGMTEQPYWPDLSTDFPAELAAINWDELQPAA